MPSTQGSAFGDIDPHTAHDLLGSAVKRDALRLTMLSCTTVPAAFKGSMRLAGLREEALERFIRHDSESPH